MGKSYKKAIVKDDSGSHGSHKAYRRAIRGSQKNFIRSNFDKLVDGEIDIPLDKTVINDYDYCDYKYDLEHDPGENPDRVKKFRRK